MKMLAISYSLIIQCKPFMDFFIDKGDIPTVRSGRFKPRLYGIASFILRTLVDNLMRSSEGHTVRSCAAL